MLIPMLDESFELAADAGVREAFIGMAHRGRLNVLAHAVGRPYSEILAEFEGEKDIDVVTARPRGGTGDVKYHQGAHGHLQDRRGQGDRGHAREQPEPPRVRRPGRRGPRARPADRARQADRRALPAPRAVAPDPRRRRLPGRGRRRRDAQPRGARGLLDRRRDPHHRQQPDRLHDRAARVALDALRLRPRQGLRHPDHPRERRRPGGVHRRRAARDGVPRGVAARRRDRPDRLPPPRPQRGRRARVHAAAHVRADQEAPARAQALRRRAGRRRASSPRTSRTACWPPRRSASRRRTRRSSTRRARPPGELQLDRTQSEEPDTDVPARRPAGGQQAALQRLPRTSTCTASSRRSARSAPRSAPTTRSTGARPRRSRSGRC